MRSRNNVELKIGDKIVYKTKSYGGSSIRFGVITEIIEGYLEKRPYGLYHRISVYDVTRKKKSFTRGGCVYKLDDVNKFFDEVK